MGIMLLYFWACRRPNQGLSWDAKCGNFTKADQQDPMECTNSEDQPFHTETFMEQGSCAS